MPAKFPVTEGFAAQPNSKPWSGVRDALQLGAPAIQPPRPNEPEPAEDCLFLNIWTPANDHQKRPVMFYNHGGGFVIGSGGKAGPGWRQPGAQLRCRGSADQPPLRPVGLSISR